MPVNVLVFIHGITPDEHPTDHARFYEDFWAGMLRARPELAQLIQHRVGVEWGNDILARGNAPDAQLALAERKLAGLVDYDNVRKHPSPNNVLAAGPFGDINWTIVLRPLMRRIREQLVQLGLADAIYYASEDGERAVRVAVYRQVLAALRPYKDHDDVRLHIVAHSLGVTISHDFLYGIFGKVDAPHYLEQAEDEQDRLDYLHWRERARISLSLGSLVSMASQLPLFVLRKQSLVDSFARGQTMDPGVIGVEATGRVRWLVCYDVDDVLGFATRELYGNPESIRQVQRNPSVDDV